MMVIYIALAYVIIPALFNIGVGIYKHEKTIKKCIQIIEEQGYKVDYRLKYEIPKLIITKVFEEKYKDSDYYTDLSFEWTCKLFYRWKQVCWNIEYIMGRYDGANRIYLELENACKDYKTIKMLIKKDLVDEENIQWLEDRDSALRELEKKYDHVEEVKEQNSIYISETDKLDEPYEKLERVYELIENKEKSEEEAKDKKVLTNGLVPKK